MEYTCTIIIKIKKNMIYFFTLINFLFFFFYFKLPLHVFVIFSDKSAFKFHFHFIKNVIFRINIRSLAITI